MVHKKQLVDISPFQSSNTERGNRRTNSTIKNKQELEAISKFK
jgi:hypothetical protein